MKLTQALRLLSFLLIPLCFSECHTIKSVGKNPSGKSLRELQELPNYTMDGFLNLNEAAVRRVTSGGAPRKLTPFRILRMLNGKPDTVKPKSVIPTVKTDLVNSTYDKP